jgi:hypothetical protein
MDPMTKEWTLEGGALVRTQTRTVRLYARKVCFMYVRWSIRYDLSLPALLSQLPQVFGFLSIASLSLS